MSLPTLRAETLAYRRGDQALFENLSFEVSAGQLVWLRGHNGRGKTSLLRLLAGLAQPDQGRVTWGGVALLAARIIFSAAILLSAYGACEIEEYGMDSSPFSMSRPSYTALAELT